VVAFQRLTAQQVAAYLDAASGRGWRAATRSRAGRDVRALPVGSHSNVVGLPLFETAQLLRGCGWLRP
jgi:septum formation protein